MGTRNAIVELDGIDYIFPSSTKAAAFIAALEQADGYAKKTYGSEPRPMREGVKVTMRLQTKDDNYCEPCEQCDGMYHAPVEGDTLCQSCIDENAKVEVKCDGFPAGDPCDNTIKFPPDEVPATALCYSCQRKKDNAEEVQDDD